MYVIVLSEAFQKQAKQLSTKDPRIKTRLQKTLGFLQKDIRHPSLRLHKLSGMHNWSISVTNSIRIIAHIEENTVYLLRIGKHEEVYS